MEKSKSPGRHRSVGEKNSQSMVAQPIRAAGEPAGANLSPGKQVRRKGAANSGCCKFIS